MSDKKWNSVREEVFKRDDYTCQYTLWLRYNEKFLWAMLMSEIGAGFQETIVPAHIFGKGEHHPLKYDPDNVITLAHVVHQRLDTYRHPVRPHQSITGEERREIFLILLPPDRRERLLLKRRSIYENTQRPDC